MLMICSWRSDVYRTNLPSPEAIGATVSGCQSRVNALVASLQNQ